MFHIAGFIVCAGIIFFAGKRLSYYGDLLAEKTGLSKGWVGLILMASVTSLPELMVGVSSAAIVQSADLATGDIMGSCAFNLGILAMMDAFIPHRKPLTSVASSAHMLSAALGILMLSLVGFSLWMKADHVAVGWVGVNSLLLLVVYFFAIRLIYKSEKRNAVARSVTNDPHPGISKKKVILYYSGFAFIIILAALALPFFAEHIAGLTGLGQSFVGTFFLAVSTSLPEIAVSLAAIRAGSVDLSVGNLLGSNIFNILILAIDDITYTPGILLQDASGIHLLSVLSTILMTAVVIIGFCYRAPGKRFWLAWDAAVIFLIYIINLFLLFRYS